MPKYYPSIPPDLIDWAQRQSVFFIGTAPLYNAETHLNVSPKGLPNSSFAVLSPTQAAYIDICGSGCETISHLYENGRATVMFNSFGKTPRIMRWFCKGRVIERQHNEMEFDSWVHKMSKEEAPETARAIIVLDIWKVQTSCGFGVPILSEDQGNVEPPNQKLESGELEPNGPFRDRDTLYIETGKFVERGTFYSYMGKNNDTSLDGLPGLKSARQFNGRRTALDGLRRWQMKIAAQLDVLVLGMVLMYVIVRVLQLVGIQ